MSVQPERESVPELERGREARVLVVDDEPELLRALGRTLRRSAAVQTASSGREAIAMLSAGADFDLILSDVVMPDGTGMDLYAWIERERPELASRVVFMTGGAFTPEAVEFTETVDVPVFEKPLDLERVRALIQDRVVD